MPDSDESEVGLPATSEYIVPLSVTENTCLLDRGRGAASRLVFQEEPCWGTVDYEHQQPRGLDFVSETIRNQINQIESQIIREDRQRAAPQSGDQRPGGDINGEFQPHTWPMLLRMACCRERDVVTAGSGPYSHEFNGQPDLDDGLTIEKRFGFRNPDPIVLQYRGCRINEFAWSAPKEGIITCRASMLAKREIQVFPGGSGTITHLDDSIEDIRAAIYAAQNEPFNSFNASIEVNGNTLATITNMDWLLNNNLDGEGFALDGTPYRADLTEDIRTISGNMTAFFTKATFALFYPAFINNESMALRATIRRGAYSIIFHMPSVKISGNVTPAIAGTRPIDLALTYQAHRDEDSGADVQIRVVNNDARLGTDI